MSEKPTVRPLEEEKKEDEDCYVFGIEIPYEVDAFGKLDEDADEW